MRRPTSTAAASVSSSVSSARTTSSNFILCTGLKKCMPTHLGARYVTEEISVMLSEEVFDAMIVVGRQTLSSSVKISSFDSISSGTTSITRSASRAACSTEEAYSNRPIASSAADCVTLPSSTALSRLARISVSALRKVVGRMSSRMVRYPPRAAAWAIPRPMIPAPMTATVRTSGIRLSSLVQLPNDGDIVRIGLAHVISQPLLLILGEQAHTGRNAAECRRDVVDVIHHADQFATGRHKSPFQYRNNEDDEATGSAERSPVDLINPGALKTEFPRGLKPDFEGVPLSTAKQAAEKSEKADPSRAEAARDH